MHKALAPVIFLIACGAAPDAALPELLTDAGELLTDAGELLTDARSAARAQDAATDEGPTVLEAECSLSRTATHPLMVHDQRWASVEVELERVRAVWVCGSALTGASCSDEHPCTGDEIPEPECLLATRTQYAKGAIWSPCEPGQTLRVVVD